MGSDEGEGRRAAGTRAPCSRGFRGPHLRHSWDMLNYLHFSFDPLSHIHLFFLSFIRKCCGSTSCVSDTVLGTKFSLMNKKGGCSPTWSLRPGHGDEGTDRQGLGAVTVSLGCLRGASLGSGVISKMVITGSKTFHCVTISPRGGADKIPPSLQTRKWTARKRGDLPKAAEPAHYSGHSPPPSPFCRLVKTLGDGSCRGAGLGSGRFRASAPRAPGPARRRWVSQWEGSQLTAP